MVSPDTVPQAAIAGIQARAGIQVVHPDLAASPELAVHLVGWSIKFNTMMVRVDLQELPTFMSRVARFVINRRH